MGYNKKISDTTIRIGEVRFSYVYLFSRRRNEDGTEGKYSVSILVPKTDTEAIKLIENAINAGKELGKTTKWNGRIPSNVKTPLHDGADKDDPDYEDYYYLNASNNRQPGIMVLENGARVKALDDEDFYSGCYGVAALTFKPYDFNGNKGVGCYVDNVIKTRDGERLAGGRSAEADFGDLGDDDALL